MANSRGNVVLFVFALVSTTMSSPLESPSFRSPVSNLTVAVGREAVLNCAVDNLNPYKVAWLKVDTQTILTIHNHVITKNSRIGVSNSEKNIWHLHIKEVRESDQGWYMCQINTDPMKSQVGYLTVVVPPDILDYPTSTDMVVDEGSNVSLQCVAKGSPEPAIMWKREDGEVIRFQNGSEVLSALGPVLNITNVKREHMGPYLCIATNGIPPSVSKRIKLVVQFAPSVWIQYQLIGAYDDQQITLECFSQAFPKSINYWTKDTGEIIPHSNKFVPEIIEDGYKVHMKLRINLLEPKDYGVYKCISKNSLGDMEGTINVYRIPNPNQYIHTNKKQQAYEENISFGDSKYKYHDADVKKSRNETSRRISLEGAIDLQSYHSTNSAHRVSPKHSLETLFLVIIVSILRYPRIVSTNPHIHFSIS
ncbi:lachesin isoform X1 [Diabrotica virgifera virgifera]|uniref:Ig-like domain-containing protein n=2 Tax=Diabrotica virgifera virgifera TaxID=50390 RepID=A0ABM5KC54_DIAVI|nr:lachesin isoform X1 [Diabrotica virgifera virgifera]